MEVVLEVLGTTNNILERQRFSQASIRVGRGYSNDLIINDEHTDVEHAEFRSDDQGQLWLRDLESVNGIRRVKGRRRLQSEPVSSGDVFMIGRNKVRVFFHDHPLPAAVPIRPVESFLLWLGRPAVLVALLVVYLGVSYLSAYHSTLTEFEWTTFLGDNVMGALMFVGLAAGVYLLSVLFRRSGNFPSHLSVLLAVAVFSAGTGFVLRVAWFNAGDSAYSLVAALESLEGYLIVFLYLWSVLYLAFNFSVAKRSAVSAMGVALLLVFDFIQAEAMDQFPRFESFPVEAGFLPPAFQLARPLAPEDYIHEAFAMFDRVDEQRVELLADREK